MKKAERDLIIEKKIKELETKKEEVKKELDSLPKPVTNLKVMINDKLITLKTKATEELIMVVGSLIRMKDDWEKGSKELLGTVKEELMISNYKVTDWINDIKGVMKERTLRDKIIDIDKAISELPKYYTDDKKDDIDFGNLMSNIENI